MLTLPSRGRVFLCKNLFITERFMSIRNNFSHTVNACYLASVSQAAIVNFLPLLFLTLQKDYGISFEQISLLVTVNFGIQLLTDFISAKFVDKIGYRAAVMSAHILCSLGLVGLAFVPDIMPSPYVGLCLCVAVYAVGGGLLEVITSPIVEACPSDKKDAAMSMLHSFYCWGCVFVIIASTIFFSVFGIENWKILACLWAVLPFANCIYFAFVPINRTVEQEKAMSITDLFKNKVFWILCLLMVCSGASEQGMSQWASAFAEAGLGVSKTVGDLAGPCVFAILMGLARLFYGKFSEKIRLGSFMFLSSVLCIFSYLLASLSSNPILGLMGCGLCGLSVGIMWPGSISMGAKALPAGGTALFALLALAGDVGCSIGPATIGVVSDMYGENLKAGILAGIIFPIVLIVGIVICLRMWKKKTGERI